MQDGHRTAALHSLSEHHPSIGHLPVMPGEEQTPPSSLTRAHHLNNDSLGLSSRQIFDSFLDQALSRCAAWQLESQRHMLLRHAMSPHEQASARSPQLCARLYLGTARPLLTLLGCRAEGSASPTSQSRRRLHMGEALEASPASILSPDPQEAPERPSLPLHTPRQAPLQLSRDSPGSAASPFASKRQQHPWAGNWGPESDSEQEGEPDEDPKAAGQASRSEAQPEQQQKGPESAGPEPASAEQPVESSVEAGSRRNCVIC